MEEYARRGRRCVWFSPPNPPVVVLIKAISIINLFEMEEEMETIINKGAIFCHVAKTIHINHLILDII